MYRLKLGSGEHVVFGMNITELHNTKDCLTNALSELKVLATTDELTQIYNRRAFMEVSNNELDRAQRYNSCFSFIILDIDHFKNINDSYGHIAGDLVLKHISNTIKKLLRNSDCFGRLGGEEFGVLLPNSDISVAKMIAERIRITIEQQIIKTDDNTDIQITASQGVSQFSKQDKDMGSIIARADVLLYLAKNQGRNKVCS